MSFPPGGSMFQNPKRSMLLANAKATSRPTGKQQRVPVDVKVQALEIAVGELSERMGDLIEARPPTEEHVPELQRQIQALGGQLAAQEARIGATPVEGMAEPGRLATQEQKLGEQAQQLTVQEQKLGEQVQQLTVQEQKLAEQEQKLAEQEQRLTAQEQRLTEQEQRLAAQEQRLVERPEPGTGGSAGALVAMAAQTVLATAEVGAEWWVNRSGTVEQDTSTEPIALAAGTTVRLIFPQHQVGDRIFMGGFWVDADMQMQSGWVHLDVQKPRFADFRV